MTTFTWSRRAPVLAALALGVRLLGCGGGGSNAASGPGGVGTGGATASGGASDTSAGGTKASGGRSSGMAGVSGGCAGVGNDTVPLPTCMKSGAVTYSTLDECGHVVTMNHDCPSGCVFASQESVKCKSDEGAAPLRTCAVASDCGTEQYCSDNKTLKLLDSPTCEAGLCDWQSSMTETCNLGCFGGSCSDGGGGSTTGSIPWQTPATCDGKTITYYFAMHGGTAGGPQAATHECKTACFTDAKGVGCDQQTGEPPFHTCMASTDCPDPGSQCVSGDTTTATIWIEPNCPAGSCAWKATEVVPCASGTACQVSSCQ